MSEVTRRSWTEQLGRPHLWVALCSMTLVLSLGVVNFGRSSPGPLATPHARVPELVGTGSCAACHGGLFQDMSGACLECHTAIGEHMESGRGLHGRLPEERRNCATCHSDHHGATFDMVNEVTFAKAGVPDIEAFDHGLVGFEMRGAHLELDCTQCHAHAFDEVIEEGLTRFIGLSSRCSSCHEDPHEGALGTSCDDCHVQENFAQLLSRGHDLHLPLIGGHASLSCRECHDSSDPHALEVVADGVRSQDARACLDCHDSPHAKKFMARTARAAREPLEAACVTCHAHEHESFRDERLAIDAAQHAASGFPLESPHHEADCASCHDPQLATFAERYPQRDRDACAACHEDPHDGQFETGPFAAEGCVACHGRKEFEPHHFDVDLHARTALPLVASHVEADCEACHRVERDGAPRTFRGTESTCEACHGDAHDGFFDARTAELAPVEHGDCARCHAATRFDDVDPQTFDHGRWTGMPIAGAHAIEGCESCHLPASRPDEHGRSFGRVQPEFGALHALHGGPEVGLACAACHDDPHAGAFDAPGLPAVHEGREGCARCHTETSFRDLGLGFDHGTWTGFELTGAHAEASCSDCHAPLRPKLANGRTWAHAAGTDCSACHTDPHGGQFDRPLADGSTATTCAKCHTDTTSFEKLRFRHNWDSTFKLDETHAALECAQCHATETIAGLERVRYAPLGSSCTDCHGVRASSLRKRLAESR